MRKMHTRDRIAIKPLNYQGGLLPVRMESPLPVRPSVRPFEECSHGVSHFKDDKSMGAF